MQKYIGTVHKQHLRIRGVYVVLGKAQKHVSYGEIAGPMSCASFEKRNRTNGGIYIRVQLHLSTLSFVTASILAYYSSI